MRRLYRSYFYLAIKELHWAKEKLVENYIDTISRRQ